MNDCDRRRTQLVILSTRLLLLMLPVCLPASAIAGQPELTGLFPAGGSPGTERIIQAEGKFDSWPVTWWVDRPGLELTCGEKKGEVIARLSETAGHGRYWVRAYDATGASQVTPFLVNAGASIVEQEPNDHPSQAQSVDVTATIDGRLGKNNDVDCYLVELHDGETLHAVVDAHRWLGSPLDAVLQVCDEQGRVLKHRDDAVGLDPEIDYTPDKPGRYLVRIFGFPVTPNSTIGFAGGQTLVYRLGVTTQSPGRPQPAVVGTNLGPVLWQTQAGPSGPALLWHSNESQRVFAWRTGVFGWHALPILPTLSGLPVTPDSTAKLFHGQAITIAGPRAKQKLSVDVEFKTDHSSRVRVLSQAIHQPLDPVLRVVNQGGEEVARIDDVDGSRDAQYLWAGKAARELTLEIEDRFDRDLADSQLVIALEPLGDGSSVSWKQDRWSGTVGEAIEITVSVQAKKDQQGEWELRVVEAPSGVTAAPVAIKEIKKSIQDHTLQLLVPAATSGPLRVALFDVATGRVSAEATVTLAATSVRYRAAWLTVQAKE